MTITAAVGALAQDVVSRPWLLRVAVTGVLEDDATLREKALGAGVGAGLSRAWTFHRGAVTFVGDANQTSHPQSRDLDSLSYSGGVTASYTVTRRLAFAVSDSVASSRAQDSQLLTNAGLVFSQTTITRTNSFGTSISYDLSPRTHFGGSLAATSVSFVSSPLVGASTLTPRIVLSRQLTRSQSVGVTYATTFSNGITGDIQGLLGTWQATVGTRLTVNASGGVRPYVLAGKEGHQYAPGGGMGLNVRLPGAGSASVSYERAVEQAYGLSGTHLSHRVNASYAMAMGRRIALDASFGYGLNTYPLDPSFRLVGRTMTVGGHYRLIQNLGVAAAYGIWVAIDGASGPVTNTRASLSLAYNMAWR